VTLFGNFGYFYCSSRKEGREMGGGQSRGEGWESNRRIGMVLGKLHADDFKGLGMRESCIVCWDWEGWRNDPCCQSPETSPTRLESATCFMLFHSLSFPSLCLSGTQCSSLPSTSSRSKGQRVRACTVQPRRRSHEPEALILFL
jgi:hypothetical protein